MAARKRFGTFDLVHQGLNPGIFEFIISQLTLQVIPNFKPAHNVTNEDVIPIPNFIHLSRRRVDGQ